MYFGRFSFHCYGRPPARRPPPHPPQLTILSQYHSVFSASREYFVLHSVTARPNFTPPQGMFKDFGTPLFVSLSCSTANATIYFTTDGSTPTPGATSSAQRYTSPIAVSATTTMKAFALCPGQLDSLVVEAQFCFAGNVIYFICFRCKHCRLAILTSVYLWV